MDVVEATLADVEKLQGFIHKAWKEAGPRALGFSGATEETIREISSEEFLRDRLSDPRVKIFVTEEGEDVTAFAATRRIDESTLELSGIIVLESATGRGIGTKLLEGVKSWAVEKGYRGILVKTEANNQRAIDFYERMGFLQVGEATENVEGTEVRLVSLQLTLV
jgi:ribosomal protein S18 acetylase RimI-like enzyme